MSKPYLVIYSKESGREEFTQSEWGRNLRDRCLHREDGPAKEYEDGTKAWFLNNKRHREDGPAIEYGDDGGGDWYINGWRIIKLNKTQLTKYMKLKNLMLAHLLLDPDPIIRESANNIKWEV